MQEETWKYIEGYEQHYLVSNLGNIKSKKGCKEKTLKPVTNKLGYCRVTLSLSGVTRCFLVHRLVAILFIDNNKNKPQVNHINGNKRDNRVINLEWATSSENVSHGYKIGVSKGNVGEKNPSSKLSQEQVKEIFLSKSKHKNLCQIYGVCKKTISNIKCGKSWSYITN